MFSFQDWSFDFIICGICSEQLNDAVHFKQLCKNSYLSFQTDKIQIDIEYSSINDELLQNNTDCDSSKEDLDTQDINPEILSSSIKSIRKTEDNLTCNNQVAIILPACEICGTSFKNNYLLKRHRQNVHATEKKFACEICQKSFVSLVYLNAHKQ